jgi:hypothetical protein
MLCPLCYSTLEAFLICGDRRITRLKLPLVENDIDKRKIEKMIYYDRISRFNEGENNQKF